MRFNFGQRSGLSLFEMLIALALLALIAAGLAGALSLGVRLSDRSTTLDKFANEITLRLKLRTWLEVASVPQKGSPFPQGFNGSTNAFSFLTFSETPFAPNAAAMHIRVWGQKPALFLQVSTLDDDGKVIDQFEELLADRVENLLVQYYDTRATPPGWQYAWTDQTRLPDLVRIQMDRGSLPDWPEFTVKPRLNP